MARLAEVVGKAISGEWGQDDKAGTGIPVLRTTNFTNEGVINFSEVVTRTITKKDLSQKYLKPGDIIIEKSGGSDKQPVGRVVYYDGPPNTYLFNNFTGVLRVINPAQWDAKYLFYALRANYLKGGTKEYQNKTTGLHNLKTEQYIQETEICERSLIEQQQIASILDRLRNLISLRKQQLAKLDELVKARFVEMFGESRTNPMGWDIVLLEQIADVGSSKRVFVEELQSEGVPFYRGTEIGALAEGKTISPELFITEQHYMELCTVTGMPTTGDLLMPSICPDGRVWRVDTDKPFYFKDGRVLWIHPTSQEIDCCFLQYLLKEKITTDYDSIASGTTFAELKIFSLKALCVMLPPLECQQQFTLFSAKIDKSKLTIQRSLDKLEVLKKALMQEYLW